MLAAVRLGRNLRLPFAARAFSSVRKYTKEHEWIQSKQGNEYLLGITEFAQQELGDIVHVVLPEVGKKYKIGDSIGVVESVKVAADIYTPVSGKIASVNNKLTEDPSLINKNAEEEWLVSLQVDGTKEFDSLMTKEQYEKFLKSTKK
eukprot:TRINITY_DN0_c1954_g1_i2.p1 TRINITY_DN0_c1954_g1~~TRINITY_DN0_c1954_g1_i2.p1  ORF type:complete len:147 (+),score=50.37 TRINITY_DN0_c1954_g1_i2:32-472(+)